MDTLRKVIIFIPMSLCFLNFASWLLAAILIYCGILAGFFIPNLILGNLLGFLNTLGDNGLIGLVVIAEPFIAYYLYLLLKRRYDSIGTAEKIT